MLRRLLARPWLTVVVLAAPVLAVGHRALFVAQDNSPDTFFAADASARAVYREMVDTFGGDEYVLVQLRGARPHRTRDLRAIEQLARELRRAPGVTRVLSPGQLGATPAGGEEGAPEHAGEAIVRRVSAELAAISLYRQVGIYRPDPPALGVAAQVVMRGPGARGELSRALDRIARRLERQGFSVRVAGLAPANAAIDRETRRSLALFLPAVLALTLVISLALFRSVRALLAMFLPVSGAVLLGVAGLELAGEPLSLVTGVIPPLVLAVGFAGAIHLVSHYARCSVVDSPDEAVRRTVREKLIPTAFAYGTTALGFGSLALSEVHSIRVMGLTAAGSLLAALLLVSIGTPALLLALRPRLDASGTRRWLERIAATSLRWRWGVVAVSVLGVAAAALGVQRLHTSINGMDLLPRDARERVAYQQLEREGTGLGNVDVWVDVALPDQRALVDRAPRLRAMARELRGAPLVTGVVSAADLLEIVNHRATGRADLPASLAGVNLVLDEQHRRALDRQLRAFWHPRRGVKLTLLSLTGDEQVLERQKALIQAAAARHFPGAEVRVSGHFAMLIGTPRALIETLGKSLATTVGVVALLFLLYFRSPWPVLAGMAANTLPVGLVLGVMGWSGIPLDVATVMTASVAFGVAVDDTFHYLYHWRPARSVARAARTAGQGIVTTSLVIAGGFSALALSGFTPVVRFGLLTALAVALALVVDAVLLPALIGRKDENQAIVAGGRHAAVAGAAGDVHGGGRTAGRPH